MASFKSDHFVSWALEEDLAGKAAALEPVMVEEMERIVSKHPSVRQAEPIGAHSKIACLSVCVRDSIILSIMFAVLLQISITYMQYCFSF